MDITDLVSTSFESFPPDTPISTLVGTFSEPSIRGVLIEGDRFEGVVTRRQLGMSHYHPDQKLGSIAVQVPHLHPDEGVRRVARLMIDSDAFILPVFDGSELLGVVTADAIVEAVRGSLDAITVGHVWSDELITLSPDDTFGQAIPRFRRHNIAHLPVVEGGEAVGVLSLYDLVDVSIRSATKSQGGSASGTDSFGGDISSAAASTRRGGFGAREGELDRMLDLPVADLMVSPVGMVEVDTPLAEAIETMTTVGGSSLVVTVDGSPTGIVTVTDILRSLTIEVPNRRGVQVYGIDLLGNMDYDDIVEMIDTIEGRDHTLTVLDAKIHLHEHDETLRGQSLILARLRLHTDQGLFLASGEGYGAAPAIREARDAIARQLVDHKEHGRSKKSMDDQERWEKRFGWWLEG